MRSCLAVRPNSDMSKQPKARAKALAGVTGKTVQDWCKDAVGWVESSQGKQLIRKNKPIPDIEQCEWLARSISDYSPIEIPSHPKTLGNADNHARKLLNELPRVRKAWAELSARSRVDDRTAAWEKRLQVKLEDAEKAIAELLEASKYHTEIKHSWHSTAQFIRNLAASAWHRSGLKVPRSLGENDPVCVFVTLALQAIGEHHARNTVSAALRRRRGPSAKKMGQKRTPKVS